MRVSVIIPVHNKGPRLRLALAGILGQASTDDAELILSADNPTAEVRDIMSSVPNKRVVETPGLGRAAARNAGAACARGDLLVFIDDDILVQPDFLNCHRHAQAACPGLVHGSLREIIGLLRVQDPATGGPGCPAIDAEALSAGRWQPERMRLVANPLEQAAEHPDATQWPWLACAGANISVPRMLWEAHGGFDERYGTRWGVEDIDFAFRLWAAGVPITRAPTARGYHMSHYNAARWDEHNENLLYFQQRANCPEALALDALLSPNGSLERYRLRVAQIRQHGSGVPACA
jgi:GT2 family glycosyltransferase